MNPGLHKAKISDVRIGENKIELDLNTESGSMTVSSPKPIVADLVWTNQGSYWEAVVGDFDGGDGVRFSLHHMQTCYRRGPWKLLIEVASGHGHHLWGCFDDADQPTRYYHFEDSARNEAQAIARILVADRKRAR
jgi:hypothetical protein